MKLATVKDAAMIGAIVLAVYLLWKFSTQIKEKAEKAGKAVADSIPDPIIAMMAGTYGNDVEVIGQVRMPGGTLISLGQLYVNDLMQFDYRGRLYKITGRNGNIYTAEVAA